MKYFSLILILTISACSHFKEPTRDIAFLRKKSSFRPDGVITNPIPAKSFTTKQQMIDALKRRREQVRAWALTCKGEYEGQISDSPEECHQFDSTHWAGAACTAAQLAGDTQSINERCRDVSLGQDNQGRWWRCESNKGQTKKNSFSRDMMLGVVNYFLSQGYLSKDPSARQKAKSQALNWIDWIEYHGDGKKMCHDDVGVDNRCSILGNYVLYKVFEKIGAINNANKNYKTIKKLKKRPGHGLWYAEMKLTTVGYQLHLKSTEIYQRYLLGAVSDKQFRKFTKGIYKKDPKNPWHQFLHLGPSKALTQKTLQVCPAQRMTQNDWTIWHSNKGDYAWQRDSVERKWEVANGHDCMMLLNWQIASLEGKVSLPFAQVENSCGRKKELGEHQGKKICLTRGIKNISAAKCSNKNGISWEDNGVNHCLLDKGKYYLAKYINKDCPSGHHLVGEYNGSPLCHRNYLSKVPQYKCLSKSPGSTIMPQWTNNHEWCYINKGTWFQRRKLGRKCPIGQPFENEFVWGAWPVCRGLTKIKKEDCKPPYLQPFDDHCKVQKDGWFAKKKYKAGCPFPKIYAGISKSEKPLCKPTPHFKIKGSKCTKKDGNKYSGWCIWNKGNYYKARKLK